MPTRDKINSEKAKVAKEQASFSFRDPEELRLERVRAFRSLRDALDCSVTRSNVRKTVALALCPPPADAKDPVGRAESSLAHKLGPNWDQNFDIDLVVPALKLCTVDEQLDVLAYLVGALDLEVVDGRLRPRSRPSREDEVSALRKELRAFNNAVLDRLDAIVDEDCDR